MKIGVLAFQGGIEEHIHHIEALNCEAIKVKKVIQLSQIDGLIIPGGESTTMGKFLHFSNILEPLKHKISEGMPVWGTCAGMILLAKNIENSEINSLNAIDITVRRNAYGSQIDSFREDTLIPEVSDQKIPLVFIRAPFITHLGEGVKSLCKVKNNVVAARCKNVLVTSFHPELTDNLDFHKYFLSMF
ncbi:MULTISPECIES: pyridoxal 5'-phosphate synthase glutaminase subunit PdxT [Clostridium]|uniref:pyridoxal 5'-phosphate synthase glutaminase subunit PdxT n=1 Tax=Clostridium TaxID=1485 RepID=UPI00069E12DD|nr:MULTISPECIES: pyridoxal 5'-phosphate synthase glutaminase subunit PdxT [Clostridium]KOF57272.1 glutamine amidotransferase [Clostridium sp. DMHC 10]MCD2347605.1 pyridoxal 5'-phosphate synthase glutaminase subunit PdxT [Clostridium guangxiense]